MIYAAPLALSRTVWAIGSYTIKRLINHTTDDDDNDVTDGYIQVSFDDLKKAMNMIEDVIISEPVKALIKSRLYFEKMNREIRLKN